jgi:hypothetical protein
VVVVCEFVVGLGWLGPPKEREKGDQELHEIKSKQKLFPEQAVLEWKSILAITGKTAEEIKSSMIGLWLINN